MNPKSYWDQVLEIIERHGWAVQVVGSEPERSIPAYGYTIGLAARGLPDLLVFGLDFKTANTILNNAAQKMIAGAFEQRTGALITEVASLPLKAQVLQPEQFEPFAMGARRHAMDAGAQVQVIQIILPDATGLFPNEDGCDPNMIFMQDIDAMVLRLQEDLPPTSKGKSSGPRRH